MPSLFDKLEFDPDAGFCLAVDLREIDLGVVTPPTRVLSRLMVMASGHSAQVIIRSDESWLSIETTEMTATREPQEVKIWATLPTSMLEGVHNATIIIEGGAQIIRVPITVAIRSTVLFAESADDSRGSHSVGSGLSRMTQKNIHKVSAVVILSTVFLSAVLLAKMMPYLKSGFPGLLLNSVLATCVGMGIGGLLMLGNGSEFTRFISHVPGMVKTVAFLFVVLAGPAAVWTGIREWRDPLRPELSTVASLLMMLMAGYAAWSAQRHIPREHAAERWNQPKWLNLLIVLPLPWVAMATLAIGAIGELSPPLPSTIGTNSFRITGVKTGRNMGNQGQFGKTGNRFVGLETDSLGVRMGYSAVARPTTVRFFFYTPSLPVIRGRLRCMVVAMPLREGEAGVVWAAMRLNKLTKRLRGTWTVVILENESPIRRVDFTLR